MPPDPTPTPPPTPPIAPPPAEPADELAQARARLADVEKQLGDTRAALAASQRSTLVRSMLAEVHVRSSQGENRTAAPGGGQPDRRPRWMTARVSPPPAESPATATEPGSRVATSAE